MNVRGTLPPRVLLVDDHEGYTDVLEMTIGDEDDLQQVEVLKAYGKGVCFDIAKALAETPNIRAGVFDLILNGTEHTGAVLLKELRAEGADWPVAFVTGCSDGWAAKRAAESLVSTGMATTIIQKGQEDTVDRILQFLRDSTT